MMNKEITSAAMQHLLGINKVALNDLAKRGIIKRGGRKGTFDLQMQLTYVPLLLMAFLAIASGR